MHGKPPSILNDNNIKLLFDIQKKVFVWLESHFRIDFFIMGLDCITWDISSHSLTVIFTYDSVILRISTRVNFYR